MHIVKYAKEVKNRGENAAAYVVEVPILQKNVFKTQNPRLINKIGIKSRAAYDGMCTVFYYQLKINPVKQEPTAEP